MVRATLNASLSIHGFGVLDKLKFGPRGEGTLNACPSIHGFRVSDKLEFGPHGKKVHQ